MANANKTITINFDKPRPAPTPDFMGGINGEQPPNKQDNFNAEAVKKAAGPGRAGSWRSEYGNGRK